MTKGSFATPPQKDGRYAMKLPALRTWTRNEDHVLRAIILSCQSSVSYVMACEFLCHVLNRQPATSPDWNPSREWWRTRRVNLIRNRLWDLAIRYRGFVMDPVYDHRSRAGVEWTPIEVTEFLRKFLRSKQDLKPCTVDHLAVILSRETEEVSECLSRIREKQFEPIDRSQSINFQSDTLESVVKHFLSVDLDKTPRSSVISAWNGLNLILETL